MNGFNVKYHHGNSVGKPELIHKVINNTVGGWEYIKYLVSLCIFISIVSIFFI